MTNSVSVPPVPPGYASLAPLSSEQHLGWGLRRDRGVYPQAASMSAIPLTSVEFRDALWDYPIVFSGDSLGAAPLALTSVLVGHNVFVDANGRWQDGAYVPGWLRRWPFWMVLGNGEASLWVDPSSDRMVPLVDDEEAQPLFDYQGQPNDALRHVLKQLQAGLENEQQTAQFMHALVSHGLLQPGSISMALPGYSSYRLDGFCIVDTAKFAALPDAVLAQWVRNGWAHLVALHMQSLERHWARLQHMHVLHHEQRGRTAAAVPA